MPLYFLSKTIVLFSHRNLNGNKLHSQIEAFLLEHWTFHSSKFCVFDHFYSFLFESYRIAKVADLTD
jgi:hypothetical protein